MNYADLSTNPDGFPLEADATLGFMQSAYLDAIRALATIVGDDNIIVTGVVESGASVSAGWILHDGDLVYFQGGTISTHFIIQETVVQKANENAVLYDRYFTKKAVFGTGSGQTLYTDLKRYRDEVTIETFDNDFAVFDGNDVSLKLIGGVVYCQGVLSQATPEPGGEQAFEIPARFVPAQYKRIPLINASILVDGNSFKIAASSGTTFPFDVQWRI